MKQILCLLFIFTNLFAQGHSLNNQNDRPTLFWAHESGAIRCMVPGDSTFKEIIPVDTPNDLQIDHLGGKIYWIAGLKYIRCANLDGSEVETILDVNCEVLPCNINSNIRGFSLDPENGKIYWIRTGREDSLNYFGYSGELYFERANLDGSESELLFIKHIVWARWSLLVLRIAPVRNKLYWLVSNQLYCSNLNGSDQKEYSLDEDVGAFLYNTNSDEFYFLSSNGKLTRTDSIGNEQDIILEGGYTWGAENLTFEPTSGRLYWTAHYPGDVDVLYSINKDGTEFTSVKSDANILVGHPQFKGLAADDNHIYWSIGDRDIYKSKNDATETNIFIESKNTAHPRGLSFNPEERKLYWYEPLKHRIRRTDESGENIENIITGFTSDSELISLVLDRTNQKMYWTQTGNPNSLYRANLDGSGIELIAEINFSSHYESALAIDEVESKIYYLSSTNVISSIDLTTKLVEKIQLTGHINQIAVYPGKFIYMHESVNNQSYLSRVKLDGTSIERFSPELWNYPYLAVDPIQDKVYWTNQNGWSVEQWHIKRANLDFSDEENVMSYSFNNDYSVEWGIGYIGEIVLDYELPTAIEQGLMEPNSFALHQNYPNPFNPSTTIEYSIPVSSRQYAVGSKQYQDSGIQNPASSIQHQLSVSLKVYDILGREVATLVNEHQRSGSYTVNFDASSLSSGVYFYKLSAGKFIETKKMILLR